MAWRLPNTMEAGFCVDALEEAKARHGKPEIFNSDQGSQFTSTVFTQALKTAGVRISMDGKGRWLDNFFDVHTPPIMAKRRIPSITNLTACRQPKWRRDMTMENLTGRRDSVA